MAELGIPFDVAEKILGHRLPGVAAIYDRSGSIEQQRVALERLAQTIVSLAGGHKENNVLSISRVAHAA
jgi:hypothetical protein